MPLTKASFAVINVAGTITSTTVGNTTSIPSITFDQNGVISTVSNVTVSISNTQSQIASNPIFSGNTTTNGTGFTQIASGTTAQRPVSPASGMIRMNSTTGEPEWYDTVNSRWNTFANNTNEYSIEYLVVAGGGGGGFDGGGGGGAGGYRASGEAVTIGYAYTVTIGAGGAGGQPVTSGGNSVFGSITSIGGGRGGETTTGTSGASGGSGGGGARNATGSSGTTGQGNSGGNSVSSIYTGGGGGAGAAGGNGTPTTGPSGNGGVGLNWQSLGTFYAGGGGGGTDGSAATAPLGGNGGGGNGGSSSAYPTAGGNNTGGGGGGNVSVYISGGSRPGANGGSGVVIIRYLGSQRGTGGTVTSAGGYTYHTFTSSSTFTA